MKYVSRRTFLASTAAGALLSPLSQACAGIMLRGSAPPPSGHKAQVNLNNLNPHLYGGEFPFIDHAKMMTGWILFGSGVTTDIYSHLNADGFPTGFPSGGTTWRSSTRFYLSTSNPSTGNWILDWDGTATIDLSGGGGIGEPGISVTEISRTSNSRNYNITAVNSTDVTFTGACAPSGGNTFITITGASANTVWKGQRLVGTGIPPDAILWDRQSGTDGGDGVYLILTDYPTFTTSAATVTLKKYDLGNSVSAFIALTAVTSAPTNIRFYRADQASLLAAGQITAPHFISFFQQYGCLRFMDWQYTNFSLQSQWVNRSKESNFSWIGAVLTAYCGTCTQASGTNDYTAPNTLSGSPSSWTDGMRVEAVLPTIPTYIAITGISVNGGTGVVTITAASHGFSPGDHLMFPLPINGLNSTGPGVSITNALNITASGIPIAQDFTVGTTPTSNTFTLSGVDGRAWQTYVSGGYVGKAFRVATSSLPAKRVLSNGQNIYNSVLDEIITGTNFTGIGSPRAFVYNATMDALLYQVSPADNNGRMLGAPLEVITKISNECGINPWICLPLLATDDFVLQTATYLRDNLNSNLVAHIEYGNENWNSQFPAWNTCGILAGLNLGIVNGGNDYELNNNAVGAWAQWAGYRFYNAMAQVNTVYSGQMSRVCRELGINGNAPHLTDTLYEFEAPNAGMGSAAPYQRADAFAIAPYFEVNRNLYPTAQAIYQHKTGDTASAYAAVDSWFNAPGASYCSIYDWENTIAPFFAGRASHYGIPMHQYEGGWGVYPTANFAAQGGPTSYDPGGGAVTLTRADLMAFWRGYKTSSNWGTQYAHALQVYKDNGGKLASNYWLTSDIWNYNNMFGAWGPNIFGVPVPYYAASQPTPEKQAFDAYNAG